MSTIRPARPSDREALGTFATDTFDWGDYVMDRFDEWLVEPRSRVHVAVDDDDSAIAIARAVLLTPVEAWMEGARVHPDHRRRGIATSLGTTLLQWAHDQGAQVARLAVEEWNTAARAQVTALGMRSVARFARATRTVGAATKAAPGGNGGTRAPAGIRLAAAPAREADAAFVSWASSPANREVRGLFAVGWKWRRLTVDDLAAAASGGALWATRGGWVMAAVDAGALEVGWCDATPASAHDIARALVDLASEQAATAVRAMVPGLPWMEQAFERAGYELKRIEVLATGL
jgi:GNAT superfamily N-acetyltransferase